MNTSASELIIQYMWEQANCCCLLLTPQGIISRASRHAISLRGGDPTGKHFDSILVNFRNTPGFSQALTDLQATHSFNLTTDQMPRTYYFNFYQIPEGYLALGQPCLQEEQMLQRNMLEINQQMADQTRSLQKQLAVLNALNQTPAKSNQ
ncbi:MAG: hypothetical protein R6U64_05115 [Bacteroidales bacterium]